jgi:hypothetical protein
VDTTYSHLRELAEGAHEDTTHLMLAVADGDFESGITWTKGAMDNLTELLAALEYREAQNLLRDVHPEDDPPG